MSDCTISTKRCNKCGAEYPATQAYFYIHIGHKDGLTSACRECTKERVNKYRYEHPEEVKERKAKYRQTHLEEIKARDTRYRQEHIEEKKLCDVQYYQKHAEKRKAYQVQYHRDYPDRLKARKAKYYRGHLEEAKAYSAQRRTRKRALPATFTVDDWERALDYHHGTCAYCGKGPNMFDRYWTLHQDHYTPLLLGGGYTPDNIVPACQDCNFRKNSSDPHKWLMKHFGKRKGGQIERRIQAYFDEVRREL